MQFTYLETDLKMGEDKDLSNLVQIKTKCFYF